MKLFALRAFCLLGVAAAVGRAQDVLPLYPGTPPGSPSESSTSESYPEKQYFSTAWKEEVVSNVTTPTLTVFKPAAGTGNGTAVVICPGGGFMALSIDTEGNDVAKWLVARGVTAFVLKYRIAHTGDDAAQEFMTLFQDKKKFGELMAKVAPLALGDGAAAVAYVRQHASDWHVSPDRVGIIGFSAGGTIATSVGLRYKPDGRPAFVAPIYPAASVFKGAPVPADAPPMFLAAATDDQLGLAMDSVGLYAQWTAAHKSAELHMYAQGGHGFGMRKQGFPSDHWIDSFGDWLDSQGFLKK